MQIKTQRIVEISLILPVKERRQNASFKKKPQNLASVHFPMMLWFLFGKVRALGAHVGYSLIYMKWLQTISNNDSCMLWSVDARL